jgi:hypothetical protein
MKGNDEERSETEIPSQTFKFQSIQNHITSHHIASSNVDERDLKRV